jgi:hypothetical protein
MSHPRGIERRNARALCDAYDETVVDQSKTAATQACAWLRHHANEILSYASG